MAGNLKGLSGIKGLVLRHGEKVVIALVGFVALWLVYKSTSLPKLEPDFQAELGERGGGLVVERERGGVEPAFRPPLAVEAPCRFCAHGRLCGKDAVS